jgi:hypothetical protein
MVVAGKFNLRSRDTENGRATIEAALVVPSLLLLLFSLVFGTTIVSADRAIHWTVGEALLQHNFAASPTLKSPPELSSVSETSFSVDYNLVTKAFDNDSMPKQWQNCSRGGDDVTCAAWKLLRVAGRTVQSAVGSQGFLETVRIKVVFGSLPVPPNTEQRLGRFRVVTASVAGSVRPTWVAHLGSLANLRPVVGVSRTEAS